MCDCQSKPQLTEDDIRRLAREEIIAALAGAVVRQTYNNHSGLRVNGVPVHEA